MAEEALPVRDGLYLVEKHAELVAAGKKDLIIKARAFDVAGKILYLITEDRILGEIELGAPRPITDAEFQALRPRHHVTDEERELWWGKDAQLYAYEVVAFRPLKPPRSYDYRPGVQTFQKDVHPGPPIRAKESRETEFNLLYRSWKGPQVIRGGRRGHEWIIVLATERGYTGFHLKNSPLIEDVLPAVRQRVHDEFWDYTGPIPAGHPANPLRELAVDQVVLDRGTAIILEDAPSFMKVIFKGRHLRGTWAIRREEEFWVVSRSGGPGAKRD